MKDKAFIELDEVRDRILREAPVSYFVSLDFRVMASVHVLDFCNADVEGAQIIPSVS